MAYRAKTTLNKAKQHQSLRSLDSLFVARVAHGYAIIAQNNQQKVCRCWRRYVAAMKNLLSLIVLSLTSNTLYASADCSCNGSATVMSSNEEFVTLLISQGLSCEGYACGIEDNENIKIFYTAIAPKLSYMVPSAEWLASMEIGSEVGFIYTLKGAYGNVKYNWQFQPVAK